ncbi:MAG TPA: hypothetical protein VNE62_01045 [Actinomycetota bacterium]|nr:hypothetical protein [Actinomycetota bacterium]
MLHALQAGCRRLGTVAALGALVAGLLVVSAPAAMSDHGGSLEEPLNVVKACPDAVNAGEEFDCTITITNTSPFGGEFPAPITDITVEDETEPNNTVRVIGAAGQSPGTTCQATDGNSESDVPDVTCQIEQLDEQDQEVITITFQARPDACGEAQTTDVTNTASANGTYFTGPVEDEDSEVITITCEADLVLDKECQNATADRGTGPEGRIRVAPGDRIRCTLTVFNEGPSAAFDVVLTDNIPEIAEIDPASVQSDPSAEDGGFACVVQENPDEELRCEDPEMLNGETNTVTYEAVVGSEGVGPGRRFNNQANVDSGTFDPDDTNNDDLENFETPPCDRNLDARGASRGVSITGTRGNDVICGSRFGDSINALAGNDIVFGFGGNDAINGNYGNDAIFGGTGNDAIRGYYGNDNIFGESGNDALRGDAGTDRIDGGLGRDACSGESKVRC